MKRWVLASLAAFVVIFVLDFIVHTKCLAALYEQTSSVWRPHGELSQSMLLMSLGQLLFSFIFTLIYIRGYEPSKSGLSQGLRYGLLMGIFISISYVSVWYVVLPIPFRLAVGWVSSGLADGLLAGAAVGIIYRKVDTSS